jgi:MinD superfamily P-loop ATPase
MGHQKRIILTLGGKGGTGKTLHDRQLYYFLVTSGVMNTRC